MKQIVKFVYVLGFTALTLTGFTAIAKSDGTAGTTSVASFGVAVSVNPEVNISGLTDLLLDFNTFPGKTQYLTVCIYSNNARHDYDILATGTAKSGDTAYPFSLPPSDPIGSTKHFKYSVELLDTDDARHELDNSSTFRNIPGSATAVCTADTLTNLSFTFSGDGRPVEKGLYSDTLTFLVSSPV